MKQLEDDVVELSENKGFMLERQVCFPLYACSKETIRLYKPFLDQLDLTYTQYIAMLVLWDRKQQSVKELGDKLFLDSGTLTPLLKKLEAKGYITRTRSTEDERSLIVQITDKGEALKEKAAEIPQKVGQSVRLNFEESVQLYELLYKFLGGLK